jgi:hypothetical protein
MPTNLGVADEFVFRQVHIGRLAFISYRQKLIMGRNASSAIVPAGPDFQAVARCVSLITQKPFKTSFFNVCITRLTNA